MREVLNVASGGAARLWREPVNTPTRGHVNSSPAVFRDSKDVVACQALRSGVRNELWRVGGGIVRASQPTSSTNPKTPRRVHIQALPAARGHAGEITEHSDFAVPIPRQIAMVRANPDIPCVVFGEGTRSDGDTIIGQKSVRLSEVVNASRASFPPSRAAVRAIHDSNPDVATRILENLKNVVTGHPVGGPINLF